ncbi:protein of unknown function [Paraburkholderia kururiensis]
MPPFAPAWPGSRHAPEPRPPSFSPFFTTSSRFLLLCAASTRALTRISRPATHAFKVMLGSLLNYS